MDEKEENILIELLTELEEELENLKEIRDSLKNYKDGYEFIRITGKIDGINLVIENIKDKLNG